MSDPPPRTALLRPSLTERLSRFDWTEPLIRTPRWSAFAMLVVFALIAWRDGLHPDLPAYLYFAVVGVLLTVVDVALHRLPDLLTLPSYPIAAALLGLAAPFTANGGTRYLHALIGMAALLTFYAVQGFIVPTQIGFGDVKLSGVLGLYLGWLGLSAWVAGVFAMFLLGGVFGGALLVTRRAHLKTKIAFGPFMLGGTLVAILLYAPFPR